MTIAIEPIGQVRGGRTEATKDHWGQNRCTLALRADRFTPEALAGLEAVSHIEVIFYFHLHDSEPAELAARHPRNRKDWPRVGIFAQHARMRPNRIGVSVCQLLAVTGITVDVQGLDAVDGTPILDIKPVWSGYLPRGVLREPQWAKEIMASYW
jgi:tRNA-Thr(GGU) m(6)t(6)A37 methyltransferase TsaA